MPVITTRFAPSPTGPLHLGHAYSAIYAHDRARASGGRFLLRFEDTDAERSRTRWSELIETDLTWLGLSWDAPPRRQSDHLPHYQAALASLADRGMIYPCSCSRADIRAALSAPQEGSVHGVYPGTCRGRPMSDQRPEDALRLDLGRALEVLDPRQLAFIETGPAHAGRHPLDPDTLTRQVGDVVLGRRDGGVAYFMASALDDITEGITEVIRGADLFDFTPIQVVLLALLGHTAPAYHHHDLIRDAAGKRLAKRDDARAISKYRAEGLSPAEIRRMVGL